MVTILQPLSVYVDNDKAEDYTLKWENSMSGQTAYEILYKIRKDSTWLTLGKVTSTQQTFDLRNLHKAFGNDFEEIQYRVLVYYSVKNSEGTLTGKEYSDVYSVIFNQGISNTLKFYDGEETHEYPLFNDINNKNIDIMDIDSSGTKKLPLVEKDSPLANEPMKMGTSSGTKFFASGRANFKPSGIYGNGYFEQYVPKYSEIYTTGSSPIYSSSTAYGYRYYSYGGSDTYVTGYYRYTTGSVSQYTGYNTSPSSYYYSSYSYKRAYYYSYRTNRQISYTSTAYYITGHRIYGYAGSSGSVRYGYSATYGSYTETRYGWYTYTTYILDYSTLYGYQLETMGGATSMYYGYYYRTTTVTGPNYGLYYYTGGGTSQYQYTRYSITGYTSGSYVSGYIDSSYTYRYYT